MKAIVVFLMPLLFLTGCLDTDGEIEGTSANSSIDVENIKAEDILPGVLNPGVLIGDTAQLPAPLNGGCNANEILEWDGAEWRCIPTPSVAGGAATTVPASGVQPGTFQSNVFLPANQLTGSINPNTQIGSGALGSGVTLASTQITSSCTNNQILQADGSGNFVCANLPSTPSAPVASVFGRVGVVSAQLGDYSGSLITNVPAGNIAATNVQTALNELDSEKLSLTGGTLSGDLALGGNEVTGLPATPSSATSAASRAYVDAQVSGAAGAPGGATTQIQFNNAGSFDGDAGFVWDSANDRLGVGIATPRSSLDVAGSVQIANDTALCDAVKAGAIRYATGVVEYCNGTDWTAFGTAAGGEVNTASNVGVGGVGLFDTKSGVQLQFKSINAASNKITITDDVINRELDIDVNEANLSIATSQLTGSLNPNTQIGSGALGSGVTLASTQITSSCTNNQILQADDSGNFVCANLPSTPSAPVASVFGRVGVVSAQLGDYSGSLITNVPAGNIAATNVQTALNELDSEKLSLTGGTLSGDLALGGNEITGLPATPSSPTAAASRAYVDAQIAGVPSGADNLGNHTATENIQLGSHYLSGDGDDEGIFVNGSGNVGVGTSSPSVKFQVQAGPTENSILSVYGDNGVQHAVNIGSSATDRWGLIHNGATNDFYFFEAHSGDGGSDRTRMTLQSGGNVGIGTSTPGELLDVAGNIRGTQLCIGADCRSAWPGSGGGGTVTNIATGTGLTGGPITGSGTISIADSGVDTLQLANDSVTSAKIFNGTIVNDDIAANTIDATTKLTSSCTNNQILQADGSGNFVCANIPASGITSVFGRTTASITAQAGDYTAAEVTNVPAGNIAATNVQTALNELDSEKLSLTGGTLSGDLALGGNEVTGLPATPSSATAAASRAYVDAQVSGAAGAPGGATTQVQFNNAGSFDGDAGFVWNNTNKSLGVGAAAPANTAVNIRPNDTATDDALRLTTNSNNADILFSAAGTIAAESNLYLNMDSDNNDADTRAIIFGKNAKGSSGFTELMRVSESGNIGIGSVNPVFKLSLDDSVAGRVQADIRNGDNTSTSRAGLSLTTPQGRWSLDAVRGGRFSISTAQGLSDVFNIDNSSGNVGIGTTNPTSALFVQAPTDTATAGSTFAAQHRVNVTPTVDAGGTSYAGYNRSLKTGTFSKAGVTGVYNLGQNTGAGDVSILQGSLNQAAHSGAGVVNNARGAYGLTTNTGTGSINLARGVLGITQSTTNPAASITTARGGDFQVITAAGPITTATAGYFDTGISGTGSIATGYGVFIGNIAGTNDFGLYQNGSDDTNYFAGDVGIGTTSPDVELDVNTGTINAASICDENNSNCIDLSTGLTAASVLTNTDPATNFPSASIGDIAFNSTSNELEYYDGTTWVSTNTPSSGDDLGDHVVDQNLVLGSHFISGDGGAEGIRVDAAGRVGVGTSGAALTHALNVVSGTNLIRAADGGSNVAFSVENPSGNINGGVTIKANGYTGVGTVNPAGPLHINTVVDAGLNTPGDASLVIGPIAGTHIEIDNNEIVALSNTNTASTLFLQTDGGDVVFNNSVGGTNRVEVQSNGNMGVGMINPNDKLVVDGAIRTRRAVANAAAATVVSFASGNMQRTSSSCKTFNIHNVRDGGAYMLAIQGTALATCAFNVFSDNGSTALTVHLPPDHGPTVAGKHTVYNFAVLGTHVYIAWTPDY